MLARHQLNMLWHTYVLCLFVRLFVFSISQHVNLHSMFGEFSSCYILLRGQKKIIENEKVTHYTILVC